MLLEYGFSVGNFNDYCADRTVHLRIGIKSNELCLRLYNWERVPSQF